MSGSQYGAIFRWLAPRNLEIRRWASISYSGHSLFLRMFGSRYWTWTEASNQTGTEFWFCLEHRELGHRPRPACLLQALSVSGDDQKGGYRQTRSGRDKERSGSSGSSSSPAHFPGLCDRPHWPRALNRLHTLNENARNLAPSQALWIRHTIFALIMTEVGREELRDKPLERLWRTLFFNTYVYQNLPFAALRGFLSFFFLLQPRKRMSENNNKTFSTFDQCD